MNRNLLITILVLIFLLEGLQSFGANDSISTQICPLAYHTIEKVEVLLDSINRSFNDYQEQGIILSSVEITSLLTEAEELLQKAKKYSQKGQNCIAGNIFAIRSRKLLIKVEKMIESRVKSLIDEEYVVYSTFITSGYYLIRYQYNFNELKMIVLDSHTRGIEEGSSMDETLKWVAGKMPSIEQETLTNFALKNNRPFLLHDDFITTVPVILFSERESREIFSSGSGWKKFYEKYPFSQGIMTLSRVGFNSQMNQALIYVTNEAEDSIGGGYFVLLVRDGNSWIIEEWVSVWVY